MHYLFDETGKLLGKASSPMTGEHNSVELTLTPENIIKLENGALYVNGEIDENTTEYKNYIKDKDILDFVSKYKKVEEINKHIDSCVSNAVKSPDNKDLLDMQKADFETKLIPAEEERDTKLAYLKETYMNEEINIISQVNDYLINN